MLFCGNEDGTKNIDIKLDKGPILDDLRVIDMYNYALMTHFLVEERTGRYSLILIFQPKA